MGNARIWYYPDGDSGTLEEIDFGKSFTEFHVDPIQWVAQEQAQTGRLDTANYGGTFQVRIAKTRDTLLTTARADVYGHLAALESHLRRGGSCVVCADVDYAWAVFTDANPNRGNTNLYSSTGLFHSLLTGSLSLGDRLLVQGGWPSHIFEPAVFSAWNASAGKLTLGAGLRYSYPDSPVLVSWHRLLFGLKLPKDHPPILTSSGGRSWSLDMTLWQDLDVVAAMAPLANTYADGSDDFGVTFDGAIKRAPGDGGGGTVIDGGPGTVNVGGIDHDPNEVIGQVLGGGH